MARSGGSDGEKLLGLRSNASKEEVKKAWRAFALQWHPDVHPPGPERVKAEELFKRAQTAYSTLLESRPQPGRGEFHAATENTNASYVRRRRAAPAATPVYGYGSLGYDKNAGTKIFIGLTSFAIFLVWANMAWWSNQSDEDRRRQQSLSTVSYGEQHAFWNAPPRRS
jgi:DnaJ-class molecular chaperone